MTDAFGCSNGFEDLNVELVSVTHDHPFRMFWWWYRETWLNLQGVEFDANNPEHVKACDDVLNRRALPTPMEVLSFEIRITGLSRVALAQITRGRVGHCYNVQSQMPQHLRHATTVPRNVYEHPIFGSRVRELQAAAASLYDNMYDAGIPPQDCRYVTLHGQQTSMMWHVNFGALMGFFAMRCENGLTDELNTVGRKLRRLLIDKFVDDHGSSKSSDWTDKVKGSGWAKLIAKLDCMGAEQGKCLNVDRVFGNTGRFPRAHKGVPSQADQGNKTDYRFDMSAFYAELCDMDNSLLFPGEREMIDDWGTIGYEGRLRKVDGITDEPK